MKKRWIAMLLVFMLLLSGCTDTSNGGGLPDNKDPSTTVTDKDDTSKPSSTKPSGSKLPSKLDKDKGNTQLEVEDPALTALRQEIADSGALVGVAYLGYAELPSFMDVAVYVEAGGFGDVFPFLLSVMEDYAVLQEGGEVYAVVPAGRDVTLTISELLMDTSDDYIPDRGEDLLTVSDGKPLLLRGNVSEIVPNLLLTAEAKDGSSLEYSPCLSGMDGSLVADEGVYDFTPYDLVMSGYPGYDPLPDAVFTGTWYAQHLDGDYNLMAMTMTLEADGTVEYSYGAPDSDILERFEGTWTSEGDSTPELTLEMYGGPVDETGSYVAGSQYDITCDFTWELQSSSLVLRHEGGSPLLYGTEEAWYTFMPFNGFHLLNNWTSLAEQRGWYYDLQLLESGECLFSIGESGGGQLVSYAGWWYLWEDDTISLSLTLSSGQHPENPELEYINGEYLVKKWEPGSMTLQFLSGEILTLDMEETTEANFFGY